MALATQTRCAGCRQYVIRRADMLDHEYDEYLADERSYFAEADEHECSMDYYGGSFAPREGEEEAYFAALESELQESAEVVELEQEAAEVAPAPAATPVEAPAPDPDRHHYRPGGRRQWNSSA